MILQILFTKIEKYQFRAAATPGRTVDDIENGEDSTSWVAEYVFDSQIVSN